MPYKGYQYRYQIISRTQYELGKEIDAVGSAFQYAGWKEVAVLPATGFPTHIIFEWQYDRPPIYPSINYP